MKDSVTTILAAISLSLFATLLQGCEGYKCGNGTVIDKASGLPLDSVLCNAITGDDKVYTDTSGRFDVCNKFGGCMPNCKDIVVEFSKPGYQTTRVENPVDLTVVLER